MKRLLVMVSLVAGLAACAAPPPEAVRDRPSNSGAGREAAEMARPGAQPVPVNANPLDTGNQVLPGSGGGGY